MCAVNNKPAQTSRETKAWPAINRFGTRLTGYLWAMGGVTTATGVFWLARRHFDRGEASLLYMPVVIACAVRFGFGPAVMGALLSFICWDYFFIPPRFAVLINSPRDWISLVVFLVAAITTAHLASRGKEQGNKAEARERESKILYEASQVINSEIETDRLLLVLAEQIVRICSASRCLVLSRTHMDAGLSIVASASDVPVDPLGEHQIKEIADAVLAKNYTIDAKSSARPVSQIIDELGLRLLRIDDAEHDIGLYIPLHLRGHSVGLLHVGAHTGGRYFTSQEERVILTLANHAAIVIARQDQTESAKDKARQAAVFEERNRLAEEVHDTLSHAFTGIKFLLEAADRVGPSPASLECVAQARVLAIEGAQEARRSVWALRPTALEEAGDLASAIRKLAMQQGLRSTVKVEVIVDGAQFPIKPTVEENLFRICQEALTNAVRHANSTKIRVELDFKPNLLTLAVRDNGSGIDQIAATHHRGFGMTSMSDRTARIGGTIIIDSQLNEGTEITVSIPVKE